MPTRSDDLPVPDAPEPGTGGEDLSVAAAAAICRCGHPSLGHDRIAARYCAATAASGLDRACVCRDLQPDKASILYAAP